MRSRGMSILIAAVGCLLLPAGTLSAQSAQSNMTVTHPSAFAVSPPLSQISQQALPTDSTIVPLRSQLRPMAPAGAAAARQADEALQTVPGDPLEEDDDGGKARFPGVGANGYAPSDANLAVGPNHVVQMVNTEIAVYDKSGNIFPNYPQTIGSLFANLGGGCAGEWGDPIVQYDKVADRWLISQLGSFSAPYLWCVAVSTTNNPTGAYYLYSYSFDNFNNLGANFLPDYPKVAVWPTSTNSAYLATYNLYTNGATAYGAALCAFDRAAMLAGAASPTSICSTIYLDISYLPSDLDGSTLPPAGSPAYFLTWETATTLRYYAMSPNFANPGSSTLSAATDIPVAALSLACGGGTCIPQANTTQQLDSLGDRVMYRMAYRNFGDHEAMVVNQSVDTGSSVGVRWYELRSPLNGAFTLYQQGTFAPDSNYRWMSSAAMDQAGDIAIGYSVSSSTMFPAIRYTGRLASDPLGAMRSENSLLEGTGSQVGLSRWGDYSAMRIDPSDDCTFWYTNQYVPSTGSFNWATFIGAFKLSACSASAPDFSISASPASQAVVQGNGVGYTITVAASGGFTGDVTFAESGAPAGTTVLFSANPITGGSGNSTMTIGTTSSTAAGSYVVTITGTGPSGSPTHSTTVTLIVNAAATPDFSISAGPSSQTITAGNLTNYTATVTPSNGFTGNVSLSASGLPSGASASFSPNPVTSGSGNSTLAVTTSSSTPGGTYTVKITGTGPGGSPTHSTTVTLIVNSSSQSFSLSASPTSRTVTQGSSASYTATVAASGGFTGSVTLSVSGLPTNARATFSSNPINGGSGNSTMRVTTSSSTPTGSYTLTITGTSGSITQSTTVTLVVNSFSMSVSPSSQTVTRGNTTTYTVTVTAINGFSGTVSLRARSLPSNSTASFSPSSIRGSGTSTMTVTTTASTPTGTFNVAVRGSSSNLTLTSTVRLVVQ